jgi:hypothetical protein
LKAIMPRWAGATGFITDAFGVDFCGGERRGGDEEPILRRSSIRIFTSPYLRKRSGEVPGAFAGLRSKENGHCHKTTVLVSGVSSFGRRGLPVLHHYFFKVFAVRTLEGTTIMVWLVRLNECQPHQLATLRAIGPVKRDRRMSSLVCNPIVRHQRSPRGEPDGGEVQGGLSHAGRLYGALAKKCCRGDSQFLINTALSKTLSRARIGTVRFISSNRRECGDSTRQKTLWKMRWVISKKYSY